jgi:glycosyltransferase involved in cell wall biosynthesis
LFVNHYAGTPKYGMEYRVFHIAKRMIDAGHAVSVIAASYTHLRTTNPQVDDDWAEEEIEKIKYYWIKVPEYSTNSPARGINIISFVYKLFRYHKVWVNKIKPDVIVSASTYLLDIFPCKFIAKRSGAILLSEIRDIWPLSLVELNGMNPMHPFALVIGLAERATYKSANAIISALPNLQDYCKKNQFKPQELFYIPNGVDAENWEPSILELPVLHKEAIDRSRQKGLFLVGYAGGHVVNMTLMALVEAASILRGKNFHFLFLGKGPEKKYLMEYAEQKKFGNITWLPAVSHGEAKSFMKQMDALYLGWQKRPIYQFGISPNKLMDYMMAEKPIIHACDARYDPVKISGCGISVPPEDANAISAALVCLSKLPKSELIAMGLRGREYVEREHDYKGLSEQYLQAISHTMSSRIMKEEN